MPATAEREQARRVIGRIRTDPVWFARHVLGAHPWSKQREILESVAKHRRTAVRSGHGTGKTYTAALAALWFMQLPGARVITTAPTWHQVKSLLWHEIGSRYREAVVPLGGEMLQTELRYPDGRYAIGLSTRPDEPEAFAGHHAQNILVVFDEASGVAQPIFEAAEGYMTTPGARMLLVGNPTRPEGEFYEAFNSKRGTYNTIAVSAFDLPWATGEKIPADVSAHLTSEQWVEEKRSGWGEGSILWDVRVMGQFPRGADDAVCALADVEDAQARTLEPEGESVVSCDVARFGSDETVIATREGPRIRIAKSYFGRDTMQTAGWVIRIAEAMENRPLIVIDDDGVGGGVTDRLRELGWKVHQFRGGERAIEPAKYPNARSESWFRMGEALTELDLDPDPQLAADLTAPRWKMNSKGQRVVEKKDETKKRIGRSPDRGDAVLMTLAPDVPKATFGPAIWR